MRKLATVFMTIVAVFVSFPLAAQENVYYQKVPKLIPQADGSYRVNTDEFYFVPVSKPQEPASTQTEKVTSQNDLGTIVSQQPVSMVVEKNKDLPGSKPYISVGIALMKSQVNLDDDFSVADSTIIEDTKPTFKLAFGERISPYLRLEAFYQYRQNY